MKMTFANKAKMYKKEKETAANAPDESIEDHYRVNYFLLYIDHSISHTQFAISPRTESPFLPLCGLEMIYVHHNDR